MARKIEMNDASAITVEEAFQSFIISQKAKGLSDVTLNNYHYQLKSIAKHLDISVPIGSITKRKIEEMSVSMRDSGMSHNTIATYIRVFHNFICWCNRQEYLSLDFKIITEKDIVRETYSDYELALLLKRPKKGCTFCEYRNWVIINFLLNSGCRAATVRNIQNRDVDYDMRQVIFRHTKSGKIQIIPLCSQMLNIFYEYRKIRGGNPEDYLFCDAYGNMLTENGLRMSIRKYNKRRGVKKTSIHSFRHSFARKYLLDCNGDAFTLQHLLGHSTLNMTKRYCAIFDADISKNFDAHSPLMKMQENANKIKMKR